MNYRYVSNRLRGVEYDKFTVMIPTYKRIKALINNVEIENYAHLKEVDRIIISWNDNKSEPPKELLRHFSRDTFLNKVMVVRPHVNSLLNRFITEHVRTDAVFSVDDDQCVTADSALEMFKVWREHPDNLVGTYRRLAVCDVGSCKYVWNDKKRWNLLLPGGGLVCHKKYYDRLWSPKFSNLRKYVNDNMNGEDLFLNLVHPYKQYPPLYVPSKQCKIKGNVDSVGLSFRGNHIKSRSRFVELVSHRKLPPVSVYN